MYRTEIEVIWENEESIRKDIFVMMTQNQVKTGILTDTRLLIVLWDMLKAIKCGFKNIRSFVRVLSSIELKDELGVYYYDSCFIDDIKED